MKFQDSRKHCVLCLQELQEIKPLRTQIGLIERHIRRSYVCRTVVNRQRCTPLLAHGRCENPNDWAISAVNRFAGCIIFSNGFKTCTQSQKDWAVPWLRLGCFCLNSKPAISLHKETTTRSLFCKTFVMRCRIKVLRCRGLYDDDHKNARRDHRAANKLRTKNEDASRGVPGVAQSTVRSPQLHSRIFM